MSELIVNVLGWVGSASLVVAYWLSSQGKLSALSTRYQVLNIVGSLFLLINTLYYSAYPSSAVNVIWLLVGGFHLFKLSTAKSS